MNALKPWEVLVLAANMVLDYEYRWELAQQTEGSLTIVSVDRDVIESVSYLEDNLVKMKSFKTCTILCHKLSDGNVTITIEWEAPEPVREISEEAKRLAARSLVAHGIGFQGVCVHPEKVGAEVAEDLKQLGFAVTTSPLGNDSVTRIKRQPSVAVLAVELGLVQLMKDLMEKEILQTVRDEAYALDHEYARSIVTRRTALIWLYKDLCA